MNNSITCRHLWFTTGMLLRAGALLLSLPLLIQTGLAQSSRPVRLDVDGDGKSDLVFSSRRTGDVTVWFMNGTAVSRQATLFQGLSPAWQFSAVGDLDGDGKSDLIWRNSQT